MALVGPARVARRCAARGGAAVLLYATYSLWHGLHWGLPMYRAPFCPSLHFQRCLMNQGSDS